jgi:gamma-glutamylcyclotransferase (GGCT)/AIG2-like uncharacterized protein YtfP
MTRIDEPSAFFVYGTLKQGQVNDALLVPHARSIVPGHIRGQLFDVGLFPALVEGPGTVYGEVVRLDPNRMKSVLPVIDRLEAYEPEDDAGSPYQRRVVEATTDEGERELAYAYFFNELHGALPPLDTLVPIETGIWRGPSRGLSISRDATVNAIDRRTRLLRHAISEG